MPRIQILFIFLFASLFSFSQKKKFENFPPGAVKVNDSLFVDTTESTLGEWADYIAFLKKNDSSAINVAIPHTALYSVVPAYNKEGAVYFVPVYPSMYPVTEVSYEQALAFCKWKTFVGNFPNYKRKKRIKNWEAYLKDASKIKYYYRLPTKEEWESFAEETIDSNSRQFVKYSKEIPLRFNTKEIADSKRFHYDTSTYPYKEPVRLPVRADFKFPTKAGLYNILGNVAEMVSEKGIAKGGSFIHTLEECKISNDQYYTKPERWLGFRCVAVVVR